MNLLKTQFTVAALAIASIVTVSAQNKSADIDKKVDALISKMSLEEKVGQMTQVNLNLTLKGGYGNNDGVVDSSGMRVAVAKWKVGSILNAINHAYSVPTWHSIITQMQDIALKETPNKIPVLYGIDAIHGTTFTLESTLLPHNLALAATRNVEIARQGAKVTAKETRASGIRWNFAPVLDLGRQPLWPRFPETYGEDPYIISQMGPAMCKGMEEDGLSSPTAVASCMKHFIGYSAPASGKDRTPSYIPEIVLREYYLPQFQAAVNAGSSTLMINSGEINGVPVHSSKYLLTDVLRGELGFKGVAVTDWEDIMRLQDRHHIASSQKEAVKIAINAGVDMSMVPHDYKFCEYLIELAKEGAVPMTRIDQAVKRILRLKFQLGLFDNAYPEPLATKNFGLAEYGKIALDAAHESVILLRNDASDKNANAPLLPLPKNKRVLVAGPASNSVSSLHGCWSYTWQGSDLSWYPKTTKSIAKAISDKIGASNTIIVATPNFNDLVNITPKKINQKIDSCDYVVLVLGEDAYAESPGVIDDLNLSKEQIAIAKAATATGKPVVLVLSEGRPRIINDIEADFSSIVLSTWAGSKSGDAIADVLFGDYNPDGKLPFTYHRTAGDIVFYDRKHTEDVQELAPGVMTYNGYKPLFEFGHGLSYTSFEYGDIKLSSDVLKGDGKLTVSVEVKNTGKIAGKHAIDLFTSDIYASITPSVKRLRKFTKIELKAGEAKVVSFELNKKDLQFINNNLKAVTEAGDFEVIVGGKKAKFRFED